MTLRLVAFALALPQYFWGLLSQIAMLSLSESLEEELRESDIDGKSFVPLDYLETIINKDNIKIELGITDGACTKARKTSDLPDRITKEAKRVFGALALIDKADAISSLLDEGLTDEHLPLSRDPKCEAILSQDGETTFLFSGLGKRTITEFIKYKQWFFLAPILGTDGELIEVDNECALPFTESEVVGNGAAGVVRKAKIYEGHQRGFETETVDFQVAIKEFHHKTEFVKENDILQQIRGLHHRHIIRHLASIDKGKKGYIIFPWAAGGNLQDYWEATDEEPSRELVWWSLQQMLGLSQALHELHEQFKCRHGDLKPGNILCVQEGEEIVLKLADFGISRIHHAQTTYRKSATISTFLTPSYQGPEVEFEKVDKKDERPRSRKYDIWSLGCVFLEFAIWILHGPKAIEGFANAKGTGKSSTNPTSPLYEVTDKTARRARVHQLVSWTIERLQDNPQCKEGTALATLLDLIKNRMLQPEVEKRPTAELICLELETILQKAQGDPAYLLPSHDGISKPSLDFDIFQSGTI